MNVVLIIKYSSTLMQDKGKWLCEWHTRAQASIQYSDEATFIYLFLNTQEVLKVIVMHNIVNKYNFNYFRSMYI